MLFTLRDLEIIDKIILKYPEDKYWNCGLIEFPNTKIKLKKYIQLIREVIKRKYYYTKIYNWINRRLFINRSIKMVEYFWRPYNAGYFITKNSFEKIYLILNK